MPMRGFFIDNGAFEKYRHRISARRMMTMLGKASDSTMFPDDPDKGDKLFSPKTGAEAEYWKILRDEIKQSANRYVASCENGKRGGRPKKSESVPSPDITQQTPQSPKRADDLINGLAKTLGNKSPYKTVIVTEDFDLVHLDGVIGDALRMTYPPNRSDTLTRLSRWLRSNMVGKTVDSKWLNDMAKKFYAK